MNGGTPSIPLAIIFDPVTGAPDLSGYQAFRDAFVADYVTANQQFMDGMMGAINSVYGMFIDGTFAGSLALTTVSPGDITLTLDWSGNAPPPTGSTTPGSVTLQGLGAHDFRADGFFGDTGLLKGSLGLSQRPPRGVEGLWGIRDDLTLAGKLFRLDTIHNVVRQNSLTLFTDNIIREAADTAGYTTAFDFGRAFGVTLAHELGHNYGLYDEYVTSDNPGYPWIPRNNTMTAGFDYALSDEQKKLLALAFDNPAATNLLFNYVGIAPGPETSVEMALIEARRLLLLDSYNYPNRAVYSNPKDSAGDGPGLVAQQTADPQAFGANATAVTGPLTNGAFSIADPAATGYGWTTAGGVRVEGGAAVLDESGDALARLLQNVTVPVGARALSFTILDADFDPVGEGPQDAFEVALLDPESMGSMLGGIGLTNTDALLNIQADGTVYKAAGVTVSGLSGSAFPANVSNPIIVTIDLFGIDTSDGLSLYFDLLGFGARGTEVMIDDVRFVFDGDNVPPVAQADAVTANEDVPILIDVLANDTDADGNALFITAVGAAANGTVAIENGKLRYTPNANFFGTDSFTYDIADGFGGTSSAEVDITIVSVNDDPVAHGDSAVTFRNTPVTIDVLANDTDVDGGTLAIADGRCGDPRHGRARRRQVRLHAGRRFRRRRHVRVQHRRRPGRRRRRQGGGHDPRHQSRADDHADRRSRRSTRATS